MKKSLWKSGAALGIAAMIGSTVNAQIIDQKDVTITMDLQPILQLDMDTPDQIEFVFDDIHDYIGGIIQYGATILKVSSTVRWDLYAVGISSQGNTLWDQLMDYGGGSTPLATDSICLCALELHQYQANGAAGNATLAPADYNTAFAKTYSGASNNVTHTNVIWVDDAGTNGPPESADESRYIMGSNQTGGSDSQTAGSWLQSAGGQRSNYYFVLDYRLWPGLPPTFPNSHMIDGGAGTPTLNDTPTLRGIASAYVEPGVYTMNVEYILLEDQ